MPALDDVREAERARACRQIGWERRGSNEYYYRKERDGSLVTSMYVGCGELADMISKFESNSVELEKLLQAKEGELTTVARVGIRFAFLG